MFPYKLVSLELIYAIPAESHSDHTRTVQPSEYSLARSPLKQCIKAGPSLFDKSGASLEMMSGDDLT